ncbi:hypothetical protein HRbin04_00010 [archaeon HR04]|nr:hypothetical protein HRbin04_00010 [archaeon HR04]
MHIWILIIAFPALSLIIFEYNEVNAYSRYQCVVPALLTWQSVNLPSDYLQAVRLAVVNWNNVPSGLSLSEVSQDGNILIKRENKGDNRTPGITYFAQCDGTRRPLPVIIGLNSYYLDGYDILRKQNVVSHELGHAAAGLAHNIGTSTNSKATLMYENDDSYNIYKIFAPTLDEIRGTQNIYGTTTPTSTCTPFTKNGSVTYNGTCSSNNPALPINLKVLQAGNNNYAFASQYSSSQALPTVGTVMMTTKVNANTPHHFSMGIYTTSNFGDPYNRMITVRLDKSVRNGIQTSYIDTGGNLKIEYLWQGTISTSSTYFLQIVIQQDSFSSPAGVYAYLDDGGGSTPPTYLGSKLVRSGILWNSYNVYYAVGAWSDNEYRLLSDYTVREREYYNRLRSYSWPYSSYS